MISNLRHFTPCPWSRFVPLFLGMCLMLTTNVQSRAEDQIQYNRDVRPILAEYCFACHGPDSAARKADLRLDVREVALELGAITAGKTDQSGLIARIYQDDDEQVMPPPETKKKLTNEQKRILKQWVADGAQYQRHWSLIAPKKSEPPDDVDETWVKNAIDRFVLAKFKEHGLSPAEEADPRLLFRRLHLDITGLPPVPKDITAFVNDYATRKDKSLSDWIDRLMSTPAWGEHRARYWLDAARYGDTHGLHFDNYREMWPYRDWVIRAFNKNQQFDQFTIEQLAGDLLPNPTDDQLTATGFQRCNITTNEGGTIDEENLANYAVDRVQTFGWVYLGLTTNCSQCHDHKFDPFTMKDFYSLAAYFRNTTQGPKDGNVKDGRGPVLVVPSDTDRARWKALPAEIAAAKVNRDNHKKNARTEFQKWTSAASVESLSQKLPAEELVINLPLNEGAGNEIKSEGSSSQTFKATGEVIWNKNGKLGSAPVVKTGATFDLGELGDFEIDHSFSYGAWVKTTRKNLSAGILAKMDEKAAHRGWDLWQNGSTFSVHVIDAWPDNGMKVTTRDAVVKPGQWQHVFVTYDGSSKPGGIRIFVNGLEEATKVDKNTLKPNASIRAKTPLRIGQRSHAAVFEGGAVQDVRIYNRQLSATDVKAIADIVPLTSILTIEVAKRTPRHRDLLFDHYLAAWDSKFPALAKAVADLESDLAAIRARSAVTHIQREKKDSPAIAHILTRGEYDRPTKQVLAATPEALHPLSKDEPRNRLGLAQWLVDPANTLTARVTVNRFWQQVFGRGIVSTPEDFGVAGALPSHSELLDWLAIEFRQSGWDVKRIFKLMLLSATYRQSAIVTPEKLEKDRENVLLSRGPRFRMDAEMVRDHVLAVSGLLSGKMYGPGVKPYQPENIWDIVGLPGGNTRSYVEGKGEDLYRRTVYSFWKRMAPPPNMEAMNAPSREVCAVRRERTNTPLQALVTLNDPQFVEAARHLAQRALTETAGSDVDILNHIACCVLGRPLNEKEQAVFLTDKKEFLDYYRSKPEDAKAFIAVGESKAPDSLDATVLAAWSLVCNQVMNLDEALNK